MHGLLASSVARKINASIIFIYYCRLPRGGLPFAFLEFESSKDAEDALRRRNGYKLDGYRIRVEYPTGSGPR